MVVRSCCREQQTALRVLQGVSYTERYALPSQQTLGAGSPVNTVVLDNLGADFVGPKHVTLFLGALSSSASQRRLGLQQAATCHRNLAVTHSPANTS